MSKVIPMPTQHQAIEETKPPVMFNQMKPNQRAELLKRELGEIALGVDKRVYVYDNGVWLAIDEHELGKAAIGLFEKHDTNFSDQVIERVVKTMRITLDAMKEPRKGIVSFSNGVFDIQSKQFEPHSQDNWLTATNGVDYREVDTSKPLSELAPSFFRWISHASEGDEVKKAAIEAGLYMVLANRYDWQLFLEVTGFGGSGKSVFLDIARMLVGNEYEAASDMKSLDSPEGREILINKQLITLPDQAKYWGSGSGIKAITGGDAVLINAKWCKRISTVVRAVVIATNNTPMHFSERYGGIARRRVIIGFNKIVSEVNKDTQLISKIQCELPEIINYLISRFSDPELARSALKAQARSYEALEVKRKSDHYYDFMGYFKCVPTRDGMLMGDPSEVEMKPRGKIYHALLSFMESQKRGASSNAMGVRALVDTLFSIAPEFDIQLEKKRYNDGFRYNITLTEDANDWLPKTNKD